MGVRSVGAAVGPGRDQVPAAATGPSTGPGRTGGGNTAGDAGPAFGDGRTDDLAAPLRPSTGSARTGDGHAPRDATPSVRAEPVEAFAADARLNPEPTCASPEAATAADWLAAARPAVVIEVLRTRGSVPREAGTRMLVAADRTVGTIGGGHLEWHAIAAARQMLSCGELEPRSAHFPLGPALGQCCGGAVTLGYRPLDAGALAAWPVEPPRFHLQLHGAGHVGAAVATLLSTLHVAVDWIDERDDAFPPTTPFGSPWPARIRRIGVDAVEAEVAHAPAGACFLVMTHRHDLDQRIAEAILARGDFGWFGLIGSRTKRARFIRRFEQRGFDAATIARMTCPIGLPDLHGKEPAVIAVGVVAQMLQARPLETPDEAAGGRARAEPAHHERC